MQCNRHLPMFRRNALAPCSGLKAFTPEDAHATFLRTYPDTRRHVPGDTVLIITAIRTSNVTNKTIFIIIFTVYISSFLMTVMKKLIFLCHTMNSVGMRLNSSYSWPRNYTEMNVQLHTPAHLIPEKVSWYALDRRLCGPQAVEPCPYQESKPCLPAHSQSLLAALTEAIWW